ncbi:MAG: radical SAM protein [Acidobacteria bacterium]|nr:radical SAM protein [Acidobacteriota bacterium]
MCDTGYRGSGAESLQRNFALRRSSYSNEMPIDKWEEAIDQIRAIAPGAPLSVSGGEPFLYPDIVRLLASIINAGMELRVVTNGTLLGPHVASLLQALNGRTATLVFSLDGPEHIHDKVRGVRGAYLRLIETIEDLAKHGDFCKINITTTINDVNCSRLFDTVKAMLDRYGDRIFTYSLYHPWYRNNRLVEIHNRECREYKALPANSQVIDYQAMDTDTVWNELEKIKTMYPQVRIVPQLDKKGMDLYYRSPETPVVKNLCKAPFTNLLINPKGDVLVNALCFAGVLGNVRDSGIADIWNGEKFRIFRERMSERIYPGCNRCCDLFM